LGAFVGEDLLPSEMVQKQDKNLNTKLDKNKKIFDN
jgi:hypothetical protein